MNIQAHVTGYEQIRNLLGRYTECIDLGDFSGVATTCPTHLVIIY